MQKHTIISKSHGGRVTTELTAAGTSTSDIAAALIAYEEQLAVTPAWARGHFSVEMQGRTAAIVLTHPATGEKHTVRICKITTK